LKDIQYYKYFTCGNVTYTTMASNSFAANSTQHGPKHANRRCNIHINILSSQCFIAHAYGVQSVVFSALRRWITRWRQSEASGDVTLSGRQASRYVGTYAVSKALHATARVTAMHNCDVFNGHRNCA